MLENARKQGASIFVYLIFCLLIAIFVINFGPQGGGKGGGSCTGDDNTILRVDGREMTPTAYHIAYALSSAPGKKKTHGALEMLIRREILAGEAEKHGISVNDALVQDEIKKGNFFYAGRQEKIPGIFDEDGLWRLQAFKNWIGQLNVTRKAYVSEQQRSMQAALMAKILLDSVQVSRDEALQHFLFEGNTVLYDVVAFRPESYKSAMKLTAADVDRYLAAHGPEVEARFKADERTYKDVKPQLKLRQIFIAKLEEPAPAPTPAPTPAPDQGSAAGSGAGSGAGSAAAAPKAPEAKKEEKKEEKKPVGMKIEDAKAKLEAARTAIAAGKQKFEDAAKQLNTDENFKANGGELGWRTADNASLGDKAASDAVKALKPGEMTPVITTDKGAWLVIAEEKREGNLTYDQVKHDIAKDLARDEWAKEAAKRAALAALDKARSGVGLNLDQMYEKEQAPESPGIDIQQIMNDPNLTEEQKQRILQMMIQGQKGGSIVVESKDIPAAWYAQADGSSAGSAAPAAKTPPAPAAGSAAGSAAPAAGSAAGSNAAAAPTATPPAGAPVPPPADITPSADKLPEFGTVEPPHVARFGPAPRTSTMSGIGSSKEAIAALFDELSPGMLAKKVYEGDGAYYVMQLITRADPKVEDFDKEADRLVEELRAQRAQAFLESWMKERCEQLAKDGRISVNSGLLRETDDTGKTLPSTYKVCMSFR
jgi:hypothetical protein